MTKKNKKNDKAYKMYQNLFEILKSQSKKLYFQNKLKQYENNIHVKSNKSPGYNKLQVNVIRKFYHELKIPLMNIFSLSLKTGIFPEKMKIAKVSPIFKEDDQSILSNYRPISVLPCFSKILECIMYSRLNAYLGD